MVVVVIVVLAIFNVVFDIDLHMVRLAYAQSFDVPTVPRYALKSNAMPVKSNIVLNTNIVVVVVPLILLSEIICDGRYKR